MRGKKLSEETKRRMSRAKKGKNHPMWGKHPSKEVRKKMSEAAKGRIPWIKGKHHSEETKKKISEAWKNRERRTPDELRAKKRFRNQRYKARKRKAEGSHTFGEWELLKRQYGYVCPACRKKEPEIKLSEDHIIPLDKGGSDYIENIQPLCVSCNTIKHTKTIRYKFIID